MGNILGISRLKIYVSRIGSLELLRNIYLSSMNSSYRYFAVFTDFIVNSITLILSTMLGKSVLSCIVTLISYVYIQTRCD